MTFPMFSFSPWSLHVREACLLDQRLSDLTVHLKRTPNNHEQISAKVWWALPSTTFSDRIWTLRLDDENGSQVAVRMALFICHQVLPILEAEYPESKHPRATVEAIETWLANPTKENISTIRSMRSLLNKNEYHIQSAKAAAFAIFFAASLAYKIQVIGSLDAIISDLTDSIDFALYAVQRSTMRDFYPDAETKKQAAAEAETKLRIELSAYLDRLYGEP